MSSMDVSFALGLLLVGAALLILGLAMRDNTPPLARRLGTTDDADTAAIGEQGFMGQGQQSLPPTLRRALELGAKHGEKLAGTVSDRKQMRKLLAQAGLRSPESLGLLMLSKYGLGLFSFAVILFGVIDAKNRLGLTGLAGGLISLFVGMQIPEAWLKWRAAKRGGALARSVPDGLDLMVICAEAGLPLGRILQVVSKELKLSAPELAEELRYTFAELQIVADRSRALTNLAERCGVAEIESMVSTLLQAERYGTPLSQALRTISDESRKMLILGLEEQAGKLPAKMSLPLMTLILPPIIAMMGAPAMIRLIRVLTGH